MNWGDNMTKRELIEKHYDELKDEIIDCYRLVLEYWISGIQYQVYIWEDGELEFLGVTSGSHSWLEPRTSEERKLYYVCTVKEFGFNPWDCRIEAWPDDEEGQEKIEAEIIEECVDWWVREGRADELLEEAMKDED